MCTYIGYGFVIALSKSSCIRWCEAIDRDGGKWVKGREIEGVTWEILARGGGGDLKQIN